MITVVFHLERIAAALNRLAVRLARLADRLEQEKP
jgi:hypothetical protein